MKSELISRRRVLKRLGALGMLALLGPLAPACTVTKPISRPGSQAPLSGDIIDLIISETPFTLDGQTAAAITINGTIPGPVVRLQEGQNATLRVTNRLEEITSIHWHGLLVPPEM